MKLGTGITGNYGLVLGLLIAGLLAVGCANGTSRPIASGSYPTVVVDQTENETQVDLKPGQEMVLLLIRNIQDGKIWMLTEEIDPTILKPMGQRTAAAVDKRGITSPLATEEFRFKAVGGGELTLDMAYLPVGGGLRQATNRFLLRVVVDRFQE
tara:strand:- start:308 stop:769 length:462 start_codon:yes stop_codon:yes gene_type:complete